MSVGIGVVLLGASAVMLIAAIIFGAIRWRETSPAARVVAALVPVVAATVVVVLWVTLMSPGQNQYTWGDLSW